MRTYGILGITFLFSLVITHQVQSQETPDIKGRWSLIVNKDGEKLPSWLEIYKSGTKTLVGRFVYAFGSARPISEVKQSGNQFSFSIPPQWEQGEMDMAFEGEKTTGGLKGTMRYTDGKTYNWTATPAPKLPYNKNPQWGDPIQLFNKKDLNGWNTPGESKWVIEDGILKNSGKGSNLISNQKFSDFKLKVEFRYPSGSNSGIYLRGRYEVQIEDGKGLEPSNVHFGGVYGFLTPNEMVAKAPGEWQQYEITLIGRRVTIVANGVPIIVEQNIPGITGGALDSDEAAPGPFLIQGDHGPIEFRTFEVTPVIE